MPSGRAKPPDPSRSSDTAVQPPGLSREARLRRMEMSERFEYYPARTSRARSPGATLSHPDEVLSDPALSTAEKKAILASWSSDARAVENAPALRRLDSGVVVEVDAILRALVLLDRSAPSKRPSQSRSGRSRVSRWLSRAVQSHSADDNDDDPPPAPAGFGIPFRPTFVAAHGQRVAELGKAGMRFRVNWLKDRRAHHTRETTSGGALNVAAA